MATRDAKYWIEKLRLEPHPEGGYYRQTYRAELEIARAALPNGFAGNRAASTGIYFLLEGKDFSAFHRLLSDEMWHFYAGDSLVVHVIAKDGEYSQILLCGDADAGGAFQAVVKAGNWFASELRQAKDRTESFALVGCTVSPGFDFADFEMARREELARQFPQHRGLIERLARG